MRHNYFLERTLPDLVEYMVLSNHTVILPFALCAALNRDDLRWEGAWSLSGASEPLMSYLRGCSRPSPGGSQAWNETAARARTRRHAAGEPASCARPCQLETMGVISVRQGDGTYVTEDATGTPSRARWSSWPLLTPMFWI